MEKVNNKEQDLKVVAMSKYLLVQLYMKVPSLLEGRLQPPPESGKYSFCAVSYIKYYFSWTYSNFDKLLYELICRVPIYFWVAATDTLWLPPFGNSDFVAICLEFDLLNKVSFV